MKTLTKIAPVFIFIFSFNVFSQNNNDYFNDYLKELIEEKFDFIISSVSADGLDESWLGKIIDLNDLSKLDKLSVKYGFNINFEGGEAETFVINCPLFKNHISIKKSKIIWDGYRGRLEILEAELKNNVR